LTSEINTIKVEDPNANWLATNVETDPSGLLGALLYANGVKSLGGINNYPDLNKWDKIDPSGSFASVYNRSAHISFQLTLDNTTFSLPSVNRVVVDLNINDLKKLDVNYILSDINLATYDNTNIDFTSVFPVDKDNYTIYKVSYK
jgi:hypothetical protein